MDIFLKGHLEAATHWLEYPKQTKEMGDPDNPLWNPVTLRQSELLL
jgi:hypothetical protein